MLPRDEAGFGYTSVLLSHLRAARASVAETTSSLINLPVLCCQEANGDVCQAVPVVAAWWLLHLAAHVLDGIEDGEPDDALWASLNKSQALNAATGLIFAAQRALTDLPRLGVSVSLALTLVDDFGYTVLRMCAGQHADLAVQNTADLSLEQYWAIMAAKSGDFFSLACRAGALLGTEDTRRVAHYTEFGYNLGVLLQISDDLTDLWKSGRQNDLTAGQQTLPILYALNVASREQRVDLRQLLSRAPDDAEAEAKAQEMIINLGAPAYLLVEARVRHRRAKDALRAAGQFSPAYDQLLALVDRVMPALSLIHPVGGVEDGLFPSPDDEGR